MNASTNRRTFLKSSAALVGGLALSASDNKRSTMSASEANPRSKISMAQWSLHKALKAGELDNLDFPRIAREDFDFDAIEWSGQFLNVHHDRLGAQPKDQAYLTETKRVTDDYGLNNLLIMCDHVGDHRSVNLRDHMLQNGESWKAAGRRRHVANPKEEPEEDILQVWPATPSSSQDD